MTEPLRRFLAGTDTGTAGLSYTEISARQMANKNCEEDRITTPVNAPSAQTAKLGLTLALSGAILISMKPIIIKWLYELGMTAIPLLGMRMLLALPLYLVIGVVLWRKLPQKPSARIVLRAAAVGLIGYYLASVFDLLGLEYVTAQLERLMLYAYPSLVILLGAVFFGIPVSRRVILPLTITYSGLIMMYGHDLSMAPAGSSMADITKGTLLILASALCYALYILFSKRGVAELGSLLFTCIAMGSATLAALLQYLIIEGPYLPDMDAQRWSGTLALTVFSTVLPSFLVSEAIRRIGPARTSVTGTVGPVATTIMAVVILDEPFGWAAVAGMTLVLLGVSRLKT